MSHAFELSGVSVRRGRTDLLQDCSISLPRGGFLAVLGPNGAGKSTLLGLLSASQRASAGCVRLLGAEPFLLSGLARCRLRRRIGWVPQLHTKGADGVPLTVREVVEMGRAGVRGLGRRLTSGDRAICAAAMEQVAVMEIAQRPFGVLSGGEQRKVQIARALAQEPELLLLDEPAGHLDFFWQEVITELIGRLWRDLGLTVVMVTHDPRHLPGGITAAALMERGGIIAFGTPGEVLRSQRLSDLYGLPVRAREVGGRIVVLPEAVL